MQRIIDNAEMAKSVWDNFTNEANNKKIERFFHLRPTNSGVTIVSTLNGYEMRGIRKNSHDNLRNTLEQILDKYDVLVSIDDTKKEKAMEDLKFGKRGSRNNQTGASLEEVAQAVMINTMSDNTDLAKLFSVEKIKFIASELILEKGPHRVDIIGVDEKTKTLYLFELKKGRTHRANQLSDYVGYYNKKRDVLEKLLKTYPINSVDKFERIQGVMVMKYAENSFYQDKWKKDKEYYKIEILFYEHSLSYKKCQ